MAVTLNAPRFAMADNPIIIAMTNTDAVQVVQLEVLCGSVELADSYALSGTLRVDISELLQPAVTAPPLLAADNEVLRKVSALPVAAITLKDSANNVIASQGCALLYGGFGEDVLSALNATSAELVADRLLSATSVNPFLSTRSSNASIAMREGEVQPLLFVAAAGEMVSLEVTDTDGGKTTYTAAEGQACLYALDLRPLVSNRHKHFTVKLRSSTVYVAITPNPTARQTRTATFLNSLGAWESLLLTGQGQARSSLVGSEEAELNKFNVQTQLYERRALPRKITDSIALYAGYKTPDELAFLNDLIISSHILLDGRAVICTTTELLTHSDTDGAEPREVELTFEYAVTRSRYSPR